MSTIAASNTIKLVHPFVNKIPDVDELFKSDNEQGHIQSINTFCYRITTLSETYANLIEPNKFKGDAFELFVEYLIKSSYGDNRIAIYDYAPGDSSEDYGVDGFGNGENKFPATVQVKFRAGDYVLTANADHLSNFLTNSWCDYHVRIEDNKNMLIIHSGLKIDERSKEVMLKNKVRELNRDALRQMCDNRPEWWNRFYESVKQSVVINAPVIPIPLREHQLAAIEAMINNPVKKGTIILPPGSGKTYIEAEYAAKIINQCLDNNIAPVIKINSSRILLCFQLFEEFYKYFQQYPKFALNVKYVNFNSGDVDDSAYAAEIKQHGGTARYITCTTSSTEMTRVYEECKRDKVPLVVFSTYHSSDRFAETTIIPDLTIHDEAHNLVSREFHKAASLPSKENFFFTATKKETELDSNLGFGMNDPIVFGDIIFTHSANEMILKGEMVPPLIHLIKAKSHLPDSWGENIESDYEALFNSVMSAFINHENVVKRTSVNPSEIGAKILVVCRGQEDLRAIFETNAYKEFIKFNSANTGDSYIHIFALSSEFGIKVDEEVKEEPPVTNIKKYKLLKKLKNLKSSERAIVFHVDMIGEGIDVSGITGVMPFRNCSMSKFVQNIGRASRLHKTDRNNIYKGIVNPKERNKMIKPCSWVIIPSFLYYSDGFAARLENIIHCLRNEYGFIPTEHVFLDNAKPTKDDDEIDDVNDPFELIKRTNAKIIGFDNTIEDISVVENLLFNYDVIQYEKYRKQRTEDKMNVTLNDL